jgi:hypothetical protein
MAFGIFIVKRSFAAANAIATGKIITRPEASNDIVHLCEKSNPSAQYATPGKGRPNTGMRVNAQESDG